MSTAKLWRQWKKIATTIKASGGGIVAAWRVSTEQLPLALNWRKVKYDLLLSFSAHFFFKLVGYLVLAIMSRYLEKGEMGEFFVAAALGTFFVQITELGTNNYLMREVASASPQEFLGNRSSRDILGL